MPLSSTVIDTPADAAQFSPSSQDTRRGSAADLSPQQRSELAVRVLAGVAPITAIAEEAGTSRTFLYDLAATASTALLETFGQREEDEPVLFYLPVTKRWIESLVIALVLLCHSSYRGVAELLRDLIGSPISLGSIHNIVRRSVEVAKTINRQQDLSGIRVGAHDEIFQAGKPVLAGVDLESTYCYLLTEEARRDGNTWGVRLLELQDQDISVEFTVADGGKGLRAGQAEAWPEVPCHGDVFHALRDLGAASTYLVNRALGRVAYRDKLERKMERAKKKGQGRKLSIKLGRARSDEAAAVDLADQVETLLGWMQHDILAPGRDDAETRRELFDLVVSELLRLEPLCSHRIRPVRRSLELQRDNLLAFAVVLDEQFEEIAKDYAVASGDVRDMCQLLSLSDTDWRRWQLEGGLRGRLGAVFHAVQEAVIEAIEATPRASSLVESLNSRLRNYFFLRRQIGSDYLELLQFFLNHHRYARSRRKERVGRSPTELLTGRSHGHWLELLGLRDSLAA